MSLKEKKRVFDTYGNINHIKRVEIPYFFCQILIFSIAEYLGMCYNMRVRRIYIMRLSISKSKNATSLYVKKDFTINGKRTSKIVEKLGTEKQLREKLNGGDPYEWAKEYIEKLNKAEESGKLQIIKKYDKNKIIDSGVKKTYDIGYMFLEKICSRLEIDKICEEIQKKHKITFSLSEMLRMLIYTRILYPSSKLNSFKQAKNFLEEPKFDAHQIYRGLSILAEESDFIESSFYKSSLKLVKRNTNILYYDCTNFFFEIEQEDGIKKYGKSKENRPNPIVQMGLFMDGSGIPLAFTLFDGNKNEQPSLKPIEKRILKDFELSKFIVCTDAGLSSKANRKFNDISQRAYITTRSIKKLPQDLRDWALSKEGWKLSNSNKVYNLDEIDLEENIDKIFYKERWIINEQTKTEKKNKEKVLSERLVLSFSPKYKAYQENIRQNQIERALKRIKNTGKVKYKNANDAKRFIDEVYFTEEGEIAENVSYSLNGELIREESRYDGLYLACTNLEGDAKEVVKVNKNRWEIEESFRIMKTEMKTRPVYLQREDRIQAHFLTCFLALLVYRILEKKIDEEHTSIEIISTLRNMKWHKENSLNYTPSYERNELTDKLHATLGFRTDYEIFDQKMIKDLKKFLKSISK